VHCGTIPSSNSCGLLSLRAVDRPWLVVPFALARGRLWCCGALSALVLTLTSWAGEPTLPPGSGVAAGVSGATPLGEPAFRFEGFLGERIVANVDQWLVSAPVANPGMIEMFRLRDREPAPNLVPWAGEFVGKYLISAIGALGLTDRPELAETVRRVVAELVVTQAEDGYLGPFPKADRLKGNWDLWGHYHVLMALLDWHELTGDSAALAACRYAADLACSTFLDGTLRVYDAGSHEMNMAIVHGLGRLYRLTQDPRYLELMRQIEQDWERAGDYLRAGLDGREFFQSPRPRWESLHDLQGLVELWKITGEATYLEAFQHHWRSIRRWDRRNTGGFSSGEQATGNPYAPTAIETCCTVAWMALSVDMLRLSGDARVADDLELATANAALGAQHPSGRWWTYNTPMDGTREASAHAIVFQARAGTPELNCCSVNGPRALGMLTQWALLAVTNGVVVNTYFPGEFSGYLADGSPVTVRIRGEYPVAGLVNLEIERGAPRDFSVRLRMPQWSERTKVSLNGEVLAQAPAGGYLELTRRWQQGDVVQLELDLGLRYEVGDREAAGKVSLYRGPLLLAYDQRLNEFDEAAVPPLDLTKLAQAQVVETGLGGPGRGRMGPKPWLTLDLPTAGGPLRLCDFASAGATGTRYRSWLAATNCPPAPVVTRLPADGAVIPAGQALFQWSTVAPPRSSDQRSFLMIVDPLDPTGPTVTRSKLTGNKVALTAKEMSVLSPGRWYEWRVIGRNAHGLTDAPWPAARFRIDPRLPGVSAAQVTAFMSPPREVMVKARLWGKADPEVGTLLAVTGAKSAPGPEGDADEALELDGVAGRIVYQTGEFPEGDYGVALWVQVTELPAGRLGQVVSAWASSMDDPLRLCLEQGRLHARIEAGQGYSTEGVPVTVGQWYHVAAFKVGTRLSLYVNGELRGSATAPLTICTAAQDIALGGNPHYSGNEFLAARVSGFMFYGRALSAAEIKQLATP